VIVFKDLLIEATLVSSKTLFVFYCEQQGFVKHNNVFLLKKPLHSGGRGKSNFLTRRTEELDD